MLMAISFVILPACAHDSKNNETNVVRVETKLICPDELKGKIDDLPDPPEGAKLDGNEAGQNWLSRVWQAAFSYHQTLVDAQKQCEGK